MILRQRLPRLMTAVAALLVPGSAPAHAAEAPSWCRPGAELNILWRGTWYPGAAKAPTADGRCLIGYAGFGANWDEPVGPDRVAPRGTTRSFAQGGTNAAAVSPSAHASANPGGPIKAGAYSCSGFIGSVTGGGHMVHRPSFSIGAGGKTYAHESGTRGSVSLGPDGTALFRGGALDGQAAKYEASSGGHAVLREYNESRSRTVIDCEGPTN